MCSIIHAGAALTRSLATDTFEDQQDIALNPEAYVWRDESWDAQYPSGGLGLVVAGVIALLVCRFATPLLSVTSITP